jgi:hypothetical protein
VITEDQTEVVAFLESASTHGGKPVVRIDTHASIVFLAGDRAWKLKRAVRYDYLDFSNSVGVPSMSTDATRPASFTTPKPSVSRLGERRSVAERVLHPRACRGPDRASTTVFLY